MMIPFQRSTELSRPNKSMCSQKRQLQFTSPFKWTTREDLLFLAAGGLRTSATTSASSTQRQAKGGRKGSSNTVGKARFQQEGQHTRPNPPKGNGAKYHARWGLKNFKGVSFCKDYRLHKNCRNPSQWNNVPRQRQQPTPLPTTPTCNARTY